MKTYQVTILHSLILIALSTWSYLASATPSVTALIPTFAGIILLLLAIPMQKGNKIAAHIVVTLTFLLLIAFLKPLSGAFDRNDGLAITRIFAMIITSALALSMYIRSFIQARRKK